MSWRQDREPAFRPSLQGFDLGGNEEEPLQDIAGVVGEAARNDVDVTDGLALHLEGQANVPVGLEAGSEGRDDFYIATAGKEA